MTPHAKVPNPSKHGGFLSHHLQETAKWLAPLPSTQELRQIECHGKIAISTLNRKFALTSDVEPCLITRFNFAEEKQL